MGCGGRSIGDHVDLSDKGVHEEKAGKNCRICSRDTNVKTLYRRSADGGFQ